MKLPLFALLVLAAIPVVGAAPEPNRKPMAVAALPQHAINDVYEDVLGRPASPHEMAACRAPSVNELRADLHRSPEYRSLNPEFVIRQAFHEFHDRAPDREEMRTYRRRLIDEHWSVGRVRAEISGRHPRRHDRSDYDRTRELDRIIERAYDDLLERDPDDEGRRHYRKLLERGHSEASIRARLRESEEYRVTLPDSKTKRAYLKVLGREADARGVEHYRKLLVDRGWTERDVERDLRKSDEYRRRKH